MKIFFAVLAAVTLSAMVAEKEAERVRYHTYAFLGAILGAIAMCIIS